MSSVKSVALIGAGNMGGPMAHCLHRAGFDLLVCDTSAEIRSAFTQDGIAVTASAEDCASADAILVLVANDAQIMAVTSALAGAVLAGQHPVVCIMSTTLPGTLDKVRSTIAPAGARIVDAPISGGIVKAREGRLTVMAGGENEDVERMRPLRHLPSVSFTAARWARRPSRRCSTTFSASPVCFLPRRPLPSGSAMA